MFPFPFVTQRNSDVVSLQDGNNVNDKIIVHAQEGIADIPEHIQRFLGMISGADSDDSASGQPFAKGVHLGIRGTVNAKRAKYLRQGLQISTAQVECDAVAGIIVDSISSHLVPHRQIDFIPAEAAYGDEEAVSGDIDLDRLLLATYLIEDAVKGMTTWQRQVVFYRLSGFTFTAIADAFGVNWGAPRGAYNRAIAYLATFLRELDE